MIWQPAAQEPDPLLALAHEAVRTQLFPGETVGVALVAVAGETWREAQLPDGRTVRISLTTAPASELRHGVRACAGIRVTGELLAGDEAYRLAADVVVDLATRAMLACECRLEALGRVGR